MADFEIRIHGEENEDVETRPGVERLVRGLAVQMKSRGYNVIGLGFHWDQGDAPDSPSDLTVSELREILRDNGVDPDSLEGSGAGGNVVKADLVAAVENLGD